MQSEILQIGDRRVFARRAGSGPALILLHGSPESADAVADQQSVFAQSFSTLAIDTPGNGRSDPLLVESPLTEDYAAALADTLDAAGIGVAAFYGFHTGAGIAMEFALRYPDRVSALVLDGYPIWTEDERTSMLANYLVPVTPEWSGAHLTRVWARTEEQTQYFPWYDRRPETRIAMSVPPPEFLHRRAMDMLRAGEGYEPAYRAAFIRDGRPGPADITAPCLIGAVEPDPLAAHLDRMQDRAPGVTVERWRDGKAQAYHRMAEFLRVHNSAPPLPGAPGQSGIPAEGFADTDFGRLYWRSGGEGDEPVELLIHDVGSSMRTLAGTGGQSWLALDLPGHGWSDGGRLPADLDGWVEAVGQVVDAIGRPVGRATGPGLGGLLADRLVRRGLATSAMPSRGLVSADMSPAEPGIDLIPDLTPCWDGGHLVRTWRWLRRRALFDPWDRPDPDKALASPVYDTPEAMNAALVDAQIARTAMTRAVDAVRKSASS